MNNLALLLADSEDGLAEAEALMAEALRLHPDDPYFVASQAEIRLKRGDRDGAEAGFRRALELLPADDDAARTEIRGWLERLD
jgi:Flp pilus assembly protein TadD